MPTDSGSASLHNSVDDPGDQEGAKEEQGHPLLEEISHNDKSGLILVAAETLECESFEVAVPSTRLRRGM